MIRQSCRFHSAEWPARNGRSNDRTTESHYRDQARALGEDIGERIQLLDAHLPDANRMAATFIPALLALRAMSDNPEVSAALVLS
jgi:hypothetical protein